MWRAVPDSFCDNLVCFNSATSAPEGIKECVDSQQKLVMAWQKRHECLKGEAPIDEAQVIHHKTCMLGTCVCRPRSFARILANRFAAYVRGLSREDMVGRNYVLEWRRTEWLHESQDVMMAMSSQTSVDQDAALNMGCEEDTVEVTYTHVCACNLRPFRATFLEMVRESDKDSAETLVFLQRQNGDRDPKLFTMHEWFGGLNPFAAYTLLCYKLSSRQWAVSDFHGQAIVLRAPAKEKLIWNGNCEWGEEAKKARQNPLHEQLLAKSTASSKPSDVDRAANHDWEDLGLEVEE